MPISLTLSVWMAVVLLFGLNGCTKPSASEADEPKDVKIEPHIQEAEPPPSVMFDLKLTKSRAADSQFYDCVYASGGRTAKFGLQLQEKERFPAKFPVATAEGKFLAVAGSDNSVLLQDLTKALAARRVPNNPRRIAELQFTAAVLGEKQSRDPSGAFFSRPPGDWTTIKIFLPKDGDDGEMYVNLNPVLGKGEFSIKDSDYGDYVLSQLAKVL